MGSIKAMVLRPLRQAAGMNSSQPSEMRMKVPVQTSIFYQSQGRPDPPEMSIIRGLTQLSIQTCNGFLEPCNEMPLPDEMLETFFFLKRLEKNK